MSFTLDTFLFSIMLSAACSHQIFPKIAVIGGGIGGTSCAYFLSKLFQDKTDITLYERDTIGGRLSLLNIDGNYYEAGGSVIHPTNKYMMEFAKLLGLGIKKPSEKGRFGIYDGENFVFEESEWYFVTAAKFFWRYGFSMYDLWKDVKAMLTDFSRIYEAQDKEFAFTTVNGMLEYMNPNFRNMTQESILSILSKRKFSEVFLNEVVQSVMMVNYGQTNNISGFAGFVSLAGSDNNLWSIQGGNKLVPEGLLKESNASVVNGNVVEISLESDGSYALKYEDLSSNGQLHSAEYDIIILASPLIKGIKNIKFHNFKKSFDLYESTFYRTVTTFVKGTINASAFDSRTVPEEILTFKSTLLFNCLGQVQPVNSEVKGSNKVYKIFSQNPLKPENINTLFKDIEIVKEKDWLAYPYYHPPEYLPPFMLYPNFYYINAVELSASAMEMSAIAAKNVALLAFNMWNNLIHKVDYHSRVQRDEL